MPGSLHHVELRVPDLGRACAEWGWLLVQLGYAPFQEWPDGRSWRLGATCLVVEPDHYAAYLANTDGFEVELVAGEA